MEAVVQQGPMFRKGFELSEDRMLTYTHHSTRPFARKPWAKLVNRRKGMSVDKAYVKILNDTTYERRQKRRVDRRDVTSPVVVYVGGRAERHRIVFSPRRNDMDLPPALCQPLGLTVYYPSNAQVDCTKRQR